ncbi:hypothetical protein F1B95_03575 [Clostridium perfringens]|uniref:hypothetical protein n=1 Tax=Clostridium perfringens TaxID=1502 RepID=UPI0021FE359C|nr:hypothetical protein [Clostridium perfringens]EGT3606206.1 hypothetical protein [Clostridium perfringens]MDZ5129969.1 hypothetical protein [Clostridium perfringens]UXZ08547.1 hypothetical protein F1B95_03575 [Clostridium perfringens]
MAKPYLKRKPISLELKLGITDTITRREFKDIRKKQILRIVNAMKATSLMHDPLLNTIIIEGDKIVEVTGINGDIFRKQLEIINRYDERYLLDFTNTSMIKVLENKIIKLPSNEYLMVNEDDLVTAMSFENAVEDYVDNIRVLRDEYRTDDCNGRAIYESDLLLGITSEDIEILGLLYNHNPNEFINEYDEALATSCGLPAIMLYKEVKKLRDE